LIRNKKGFTLIEMVVVLAVIAILAAILTPTLTRYIESARVRRAENDCKVIAGAVAAFNADVGEWPIWISGAQADMRSADDAVNLLVGPGTDPLNTGSLADWDDALSSANAADSIATISAQLNENDPGYATGPGRRQWKGPYLSEAAGRQEIGIDPWGNKYLVVVKSLQPGAADTDALSLSSYVLSAGPNEVIETAFDLPLGTGVAPGPDGDDIWCPIR